MATQATISRLPKDAKWVERYRACDYCSCRSVGILMSDRNETLGVACESCSRLAMANRRVRA